MKLGAFLAVLGLALLSVVSAQEDKRSGLSDFNMDMAAEMAQLQRPRFGKRFAEDESDMNKRQDLLEALDSMSFQRPRFGRRK